MSALNHLPFNHRSPTPCVLERWKRGRLCGLSPHPNAYTITEGSILRSVSIDRRHCCCSLLPRKVGDENEAASGQPLDNGEWCVRVYGVNPEGAPLGLEYSPCTSLRFNQSISFQRPPTPRRILWQEAASPLLPGVQNVGDPGPRDFHRIPAHKQRGITGHNIQQ